MAGYHPMLADYDFGEVLSAMQKSIRRGLEEDAFFWAIVLDDGGYPWAMWRRLQVIAFEDCGSPEVIDHVLNCSRWYSEFRKEREKAGRGMKDERLALASAVLAMCRCPHNRINDDMQAVLYHRYENELWRLPVPAWAVDRHTAAGRAAGKGMAEFLTEGSKLANEVSPEQAGNPWRAEWEERELGRTTAQEQLTEE